MGGPTLIFDKSFLQSLSVDEAVWLDHFFTCGIVPIFLTETLGDLRKQFPDGRLPEREVARIAAKTPQLGGMPCVFHRTLAVANLEGHRIPMNGRIPMAGGHVASAGGRTGTQFDEPPESRAVHRWIDGKFDEAESLLADQWRHTLKSARLADPEPLLHRLGLQATRCSSLADAAAAGKDAVARVSKPHDVFGALVELLEIERARAQEILRRWSVSGFPPLTNHAPYAAFLLRVEATVALALRSSLESADRAAHVADVAYLYYLPFGLVFVSSDKLHRRLVPHLQRPELRFAWGPDLKADLKRTNEEMLALPENVRDQGIFQVAPKPPQRDGSIVAELYDHFCPGWRTPKESSSVGREVPAWMRELSEKRAGPLPKRPADWDADKGEFLMVSHVVRRRRGSWLLVPPEQTPPPTAS